MMGLSCLRAKLAQFRVRNDGIAVVEFALLLPIMLLIYLGSVEASALISMDRRVQSASGALGDLVARSDKALTPNNLNDYFRAASGIMAPYSASGLNQVVTQVFVARDGKVTVDWSRQFVNGVHAVGTKYRKNAPFNLPKEMVDIARGNYVIVAEASYAYKPLSGIVFDQPVNLYRENFFMPRFGGAITYP